MGKDVLPPISREQAEIVVSLGTSTRNQKFWVKKGLVRTPEEDRDVHASRAMADDLSQGISQITHDKSKSESHKIFIISNKCYNDQITDSFAFITVILKIIWQQYKFMLFM